MRYSLVGDELVRVYFYLNPDDGVLTLRKPLLSVTATEFQVNIADYRALQANITLTVRPSMPQSM